MCNFFSFCGDGKGKYLYLDWEDRRTLLGKSDPPDSHTFILTNKGIKAKAQDRYSKYEYNPITKIFTVDQGVEGHDHQAAKDWVEKLSWKRIIPALIIKPIHNPLKRNAKIRITKSVLADLKTWATVWDSIGAYYSSFFNIEYKYDFSPAIRLWDNNLVPSFDGQKWRLHHGPKAEIVWEGEIKDIK